MKTLAVFTENNHIISELFDEDHKVQLIAASEKNDIKAHVGDIYLARVTNILKNINAVFIEYEKGCNGYLSLSEKNAPVIIHSAGTHVDRNVKKLVQGDEVLVQVKKEAARTKLPAFTSKIEIADRYTVVSLGNPGTGVSGKIKDKEKKRLIRECLERVLDRSGRSDLALIARTGAENLSLEELTLTADASVKRFINLIQKAHVLKSPAVLKKEPPVYVNIALSECASGDLRVTTNDKEIYGFLREHSVGSDNRSEEKESSKVRLELWDNENQGNMDTVLRIKKNINDALGEKVWLKSGGYLVIQVTEAMTVVDVNSGSDMRKSGKTQETFKRINLEAARETLRQLRLRNLSGIIIVDFIDMESDRDNGDVLHYMREIASHDSVSCSVIDMTKLGLVEITRKKEHKPLYEQVKDWKKGIKGIAPELCEGHEALK